VIPMIVYVLSIAYICLALPTCHPLCVSLSVVCIEMVNKFAYFSSSLAWQKLNFLCKNAALLMTKK